MTTKVSISEVTLQFERLVDLVLEGEDVLITRDGQPVMKLVKVDQVQKPIEPGFARDLFAEFDDDTLEKLRIEMAQIFEK
jgi:antitoxin (DNA-binding transcriptional repressor) of toxin-antitoxin stability system